MSDKTDKTGKTDTTGTTATEAAPGGRRPRLGGRGRRPEGEGEQGAGPAAHVAKARTLVARVVWLVCALFALVLALAVLLIALEANTDNDLVRWIIARADNVDLYYFDLQNPIKDFDDAKGPSEDVGTALLNYGIAAVLWLGIGKLLDKLIRP